MRICMISDFFHPNTGGVETHIWCLSQFLIHHGHTVIVVTHAYHGRQGIRALTNGLKVYYLPLTVCFDQIILPTICSFFLLLRTILVRERITIVHCHQSGSSLAAEALLCARALGYHVCYTDHSLFGFGDIFSIHLNKILEAILSEVDHIICVSNSCRENLVLRARLHPSNVSTIPNAVDCSNFVPNKRVLFSKDVVNIIVMSRLVQRKGIDLLVKVIPIVCAMATNVNFIIGGDGPKLLTLEEMREKFQLQDRVDLLGSVPHHKVREVLAKGQIFLNCSLTESFCIAILEAASCGLFVVSTNVGGVPEVLPKSMVIFADPEAYSLVEAILTAIKSLSMVDPWEFHERINVMYNWSAIANRTVKIYDAILQIRRPKLLERLRRYFSVGPFYGLFLSSLSVFLHLITIFVELVFPINEIELSAEIKFSKDLS
mmetsp:Transcript_7640/g.8329  ORF Transcript_7640/g.8329 Transcript_7640/m.8329 type:complete len:431 (+) Transcript_7640:5-1297(+)